MIHNNETNYFENLDYHKYCVDHDIHKLPLINVDISQYGDLAKKQERDLYSTVDPLNFVPFPPELDDLIRLHYLITCRKVITVMEFGLGKSTSVFADAIAKNKKQYADVVKEKIRNSNQFEVHSIENNISWLGQTRKNLEGTHASGIVHFHACPLEIGTFNDRMCTYYNGIPNISPDFIYIDGPDQFSAGGSLRGMNTNHPDRMPMAADVLAFEHFLCPGTLIVVDGRTANARFLKANLQRDWHYYHSESLDQHFFELIEPPLGPYNRAKIEFSLGEHYFNRLEHAK